jgi:hypothetical protein
MVVAAFIPDPHSRPFTVAVLPGRTPKNKKAPGAEAPGAFAWSFYVVLVRIAIDPRERCVIAKAGSVPTAKSRFFRA